VAKKITTKKSQENGLTPEVKEAIGCLIDYSWDEELLDYQGQEDDEKEGHIFPKLVILNNFIEGIDKKPEDYIE
jgi:phosphoenolpyruvate carboxylase